jgi:hypothetical protein
MALFLTKQKYLTSGSSETNNDADVLVICTTPSITITKDGTFNDSTSPNGITNPGIQSLIFVIKIQVM